MKKCFLALAILCIAGWVIAKKKIKPHSTFRDCATCPGGCSWSGLPTDSAAKPWDPNPKASCNHLGFAQSEDDPVVCITWTDVQDYITWVSKKTKKTYRLLSETEWEYAARAGTTTPYPWGTVASHRYANYGADWGYAGLALGKDKWMYTSPVGSFLPNAFGLYDMIGNVNQYMEDYFWGSYDWLADDGTAYKKIGN